MKRRAVWWIALRYLFGRGGRETGRIVSAVVIIGLSLVPLVVVLQVADGMIEGIARRFIETGTYHVRATARRPLTEQEREQALAKLEQLPGVRHVTPEVQGMGLAHSLGDRTGVTLRGVPAELWEQDEGFREYIEVREGRFDLSERDGAVLGTETAASLGVAPGDELRILTVRPSPRGGFLPRVTRFTVRGVISTGYQELDRLWVFIPYERGLEILDRDAATEYIGIKVDDPFVLENPLFRGSGAALFSAAARTAAHVPAAAADELGRDWRVDTWYEAERTRYISFQTTKNLLTFIMLLIVCVAAVNISSALVLLGIEKQHEIAILKSVGASPRDITQIFILAGFIAGVLGTLLGLAVGMLVAVNINETMSAIEFTINAFQTVVALVAVPFGGVEVQPLEILSAEFYLERIPIRLSFPELFVAGAAAILIATGASVIPARRAGATRPLDVMRRY